MTELRKMARDAGFNTEFDDYVIDHWQRFEKFARLINAAALAQPEKEPLAPLTNSEIHYLFGYDKEHGVVPSDAISFVRDVEKAHGIGVKNERRK